MKTKLTSNVSFLSPFLKGLGRIVPIERVSSVKGYRVTKGLTERQQASIIRHSQRKYSINLKVQALKNKKYEYPTLEQVLLDFSHELAHLIEWHHTPEHFRIQSKIMLHFAKQLRNNGIKEHNVRINRIRS